MKIELDKRFIKKVKGIFHKYEFEVGIIEDGPYFKPKRGVRGLKGADVLSRYAGGPVRKKSNKPSRYKLSQISESNRKKMGVNYLTKPFEKTNSDIIRFSGEFFKYAFGKSQPKRLMNLLQAIVRNPILRKDYGGNGPLAQKIKGFDRKMIDTAQLFKGIKARIIKR